MKRIITILLLTLGLLPCMAQKKTTITIKTADDCPFLILEADADLDEWDMEKGKTVRHEKKLEKRTLKEFQFKTIVKNTTKVFLLVRVIYQEREYLTMNYSLPIVPGEHAIITIHDNFNYEVSGSRIYREYNNARKAIWTKGGDRESYISLHKDEPGCALYTISYTPTGAVSRRTSLDSIYANFKPSVFKRIGLSENPKHNNISRNENADIMYHWRKINETGGIVKTLDRSLEGTDLMDSLSATYKGKPTLISCWKWVNSSSTPDAYELLAHADGLNRVYLSTVDRNYPLAENRWKSDIEIFKGDHYLLLASQFEQLANTHFPHQEEDLGKMRFYLLLDAEGKLVGTAHYLREIRNLLPELDRQRELAGLAPYKRAPYVIKYLDISTSDRNAMTDEEKANVLEASERMTHSVYKSGDNRDGSHWRHIYAIELYDLTPKQFGVSKRLYEYVKKKAEKETDEYQKMFEEYMEKNTASKP